MLAVADKHVAEGGGARALRGPDAAADRRKKSQIAAVGAAVRATTKPPARLGPARPDRRRRPAEVRTTDKIRPCRLARSSSLRFAVAVLRPAVRRPASSSTGCGLARSAISRCISTSLTARTRGRRGRLRHRVPLAGGATCGTRSTPRAARRARSRRAKGSRSCCRRAISCARWPAGGRRRRAAAGARRRVRMADRAVLVAPDAVCGVSDPMLGRNAAFYVFTLPLLELARGLALALVVLAAIGAGRGLRLCRRTGADAVRPPHGARACAAMAPCSPRRCSSSSRLAPGSISRGSWSRRPASFRAPVTPTSMRACRRRSP